MAYYLTGSSRRRMTIVRPAKKPRALGGIGDDINDIFGGGVAKLLGLGPPSLADAMAQQQAAADQSQNQAIVSCLSQANAQVSTLDDQINSLSKNWNPSGYYQPDQVSQLLSMVNDLMGQAETSILSQLATFDVSSDNTNLLRDAQSRMGDKAHDALAFQAAVAAKPQVVEAPGLKRWVITTMQACRDAFTVATVIGCNQPGWLGVLGAFEAAFAVVAAFAQAMAEVALAIGMDIAKVPDTIGTLYDLLKIGAVVAGGYILYTEYQKRWGKKSA